MVRFRYKIMAFTIERHENFKAGLCRIEGDIDIAVVPELREALEGLIETGFANIVLDLSGVTYVDSSALGLLVWLDRRLQQHDGKTVLVGMSREVRRILEVSRIATIAPSLSASKDVESALNGFQRVEEEATQLWSHRLVMKPGVENLAQTRDKVCDLLASLRFSDTALFDIKVALGEALSNAIRHGSVDQQGLVTVEVRAFEDRIVIDVTDVGIGFNGEHAGSNDLYASDGRGIMFMRALMDSVCFTSAAGGGTVVTLVKHRAVVGSD